MDGDQIPQEMPPPASTQDIPPMKKVKKQYPQKTIDQFWDKFVTNFPGKVETILPSNIYAKSRAAKTHEGVVHGQAATKSYDEARAECVGAVNKISKECRRVNMKYRDPHFDIDFDLKWNKRDCLDGLTVDQWDEDLAPKSVKRVPEIFDKPVFYDDGASASDVRQGADGDCWFMSALCALANEKHLIDNVCVARDEKVGVYGFVFHRDGSWMHTVIDDKLYLRHADYTESVEEKYTWDQLNRLDSDEEYRKTYQTGSRALYFAQCSSENETWLPLLEKAYAKAHGDYKAIDGGFTGEALEDLTGGVTTELFTTDILDLDQFWNEELLHVNKDFLLGCATGCFDKWLGGGDDKTGAYNERKGVVPMHAYSILEAREVKNERLVRVRNPWGVKEWSGAWSDGSEQWTPEWMELLGHKFGNDGMFWISYKDLIRKYQAFDRTRLFGPEWSITQQWTSLDVPWSADYNDTKFSIKLTKKSHVVIVLSQLDERYFYGLEGQYYFRLHFRLEKDEDGEHDYIVRSHGNYLMHRSVSADLELEAGTYSVLMKVTAKRDLNRATPEEVVREYSKRSQDKLLITGMAYDLAHAKAQIKETEQEKALREQREKKRGAAEHKKLREEFRAYKYKEWLHTKKAHERQKRHALAKEERRRKKASEHKAADVADSHMPPVKGEKPEAEEQAIGGASEKTPLPTVHELPSPPTEVATQDHQYADDDIPKKNQTTEDKIKQFNRSLAAITQDSIVPQLNVPSASIPPAPPSTLAPPPSTAGGLDDDYDSDASFNSSIDTDLDNLALTPPTPKDGADPPLAADDDIEEDLEFENDPWNAVCVVGLRVYSKDPALSVLIVRPKNVDEDEETPLDVDDPSKGASEEPIPGAAEEKKGENGVVVS